MVEKSSSYREESKFLSDLKEFERTTLSDLKVKLEEAILGNNLYKREEPKKNEKKAVEESAGEKEKSVKEEEGKETEKFVEVSKPEGDDEEKGEKEENNNVDVEEKGKEIDRISPFGGYPFCRVKALKALM